MRVPLGLAIVMACLFGVISGIAPAKNGNPGNGNGGSPPGLTRAKPQKAHPHPSAARPVKPPKPSKPPKPNGATPSGPTVPPVGNRPSTPAAPAPPANNSFGAGTTTSDQGGTAGDTKRKRKRGGDARGDGQGGGGGGGAQGGGVGAAQSVVEQDEGVGSAAENATAGDGPEGTGRLGELPFTGLQTLVLLLIGLDLVYVGIALRRRLGEISAG